jgi:ring-1,2-phenylacetyl-CoA epoxidase subunit PaaE
MPSSAIEQPRLGPANPPAFHPLVVAGVRPETRDAVVVTLEIPAQLKAAFRVTQGQHLDVRAWIGNEEVKRSYSVCSAAAESDLRIAIKRTPGGTFSNWANDSLQPGMILETSTPQGHFSLPLDPSARRHYAAFATGIGITPILGMVKTTLLTESESQFTLFYGSRSSGTALFREELADLKDYFLSRFNLVHVMTREHQDLDLLNGRLSPERAEQLLRTFSPLPTLNGIFISCPRDTALPLRDRFKALGFPRDQLKVELFTAGRPALTRPRPAAAAAEGCEVSVVFDGRIRTFAMEKGNETVLDAALRNGIELRYSCKSGVCSTCRCKLTEGQVEMDASYALETYEVERGFVLACQSYPTSSRLTIDFDLAE